MMMKIPPHQSRQLAQLQLHFAMIADDTAIWAAAPDTAAGGLVLEIPRQSLVDAAGAACEEGVLEMKYLETPPHHQMMRMMMMMMTEIPPHQSQQPAQLQLHRHLRR